MKTLLRQAYWFYREVFIASGGTVIVTMGRVILPLIINLILKAGS